MPPSPAADPLQQQIKRRLARLGGAPERFATAESFGVQKRGDVLPAEVLEYAQQRGLQVPQGLEQASVALDETFGLGPSEVQQDGTEAETEALGEREFRGYASVFGTVVDSWIQTVIERGAFTNTLRDIAEGRGHIPVLWQHWDPIGKSLELNEDQRGLLIRGRLSEILEGNKAITLLRDGVVDQMSIGFDLVRWEFRRTPDDEIRRHVFELDLREVSLVTFAADSTAFVEEVASRQQITPPSEASLEAVCAAIKKQAEHHEGKVLSATNAQLVRDAMAALQALLEAAEPESESEEATQAAPMQEAAQMELAVMEAELKQAELLLGKRETSPWI